MRLVPITAADALDIAGLATDTFTETFGHLYPPEDLDAFVARFYDPAVLAAEIADPRQAWRLIRDDDGLAAYLQCGPVSLPHPEADPASHGEVKRLYVRASRQGRGYGRRLLAEALDCLDTHYGDAPQWLGVWSENHKAQALYAAHGFVRAGEYGFAVGRSLDHEFILRRDPAPATRPAP